ncbi:hypothetical protein INR77_08795 [Erythrobacter sp. SCSIO 43205]|uniref:hypothetical protein n=1 Tax=Erythrobacter sp. SCSIO 43205 TaxID=2779361 RepID=UPI001CA84BCC|nr:hypothetical protein [Erythrobacter sp. SCSIO 43205]UAB76944.1 hypothetical protein INR77_08795 [Erythrobacter sp. SCSIO 43205]
MIEEFAAWFRGYFAIIFGLAIGAVAHFGKRIADEDTIGWRQVIGFTMQLGLIGLVASVSTKQIGITDNDMRALVTAILAISANEVIQWLKRNGWLRFMPDAAVEERERK